MSKLNNTPASPAAPKEPATVAEVPRVTYVTTEGVTTVIKPEPAAPDIEEKE